MTDFADVACLLYCLPHDPDTTLKFVLQTTVTCLGRLRSQQLEPPHAGHLRLDLPTVSLRHARICCIGGQYELQNWHGRYGIGLYEQELRPGESHRLTHGDVFRIPAREAHVRLQFFEEEGATLIRPLDIERLQGRVYVFGEQLRFTLLEYRLIAHLYENAGRVCTYDELLAVLWSDANPYGRKENLEVLLHDVRAKLRNASGKFTFLQTVRAQGVRLIV